MDPALLSSVTLLAQVVDTASTAVAEGASAQAAIHVDPLPAAAIAFLFVINIIALGFLLGGLMLSSLFEFRSKKKPILILVARAINQTVLQLRPLVNIFIIAPLLIANTFYFLYLISIGSSSLSTWGMMIPVTAMQMMIMCMHRCTWPKGKIRFDLAHASIGLIATVIAVLLPLIYLTGIGMTDAAKSSFPDALFLAIPRWIHMLLMAVAATSLLLSWYLGSPQSPLSPLGSKALTEVRRGLQRISLITLILQFVVGVVVLMMMHFEYMSAIMGLFLALSIVASVVTMVMLSADVNGQVKTAGRFLPHATTLLLLTVLFMAMTRFAYQSKADSMGTGSLRNVQNNFEPDDPPAIRAMPGRQLYITHCNVCHSTQTLAPSLSEIQSIYKDDTEALMRWANQPGRKRAQYGPMPPMSHLRKRTLQDIAQYMLASGKQQNEPAKQPKKDSEGKSLPSEPSVSQSH